MLRHAQIVVSAVLCSLYFLLNPTLSIAQSDAEHLSHHPELAAQATVAPNSGQAVANTQGAVPGGPPGAPAGMMQQMGEMMNKMGVPPKKDFYPSLVEIPVLTPDRWDEIQQTAHGRMTDGLGQLSTGLGSLSAAVDADNFALMQQSLDEMRQAIRMVESGLSAHRLLAEGESPRNIALNWFKTEMNLASPNAPEAPHTLLGVTPFHLLTMVLLISFGLTMVAMYFFKMRRAAALFGRFDPDTNPPAGWSPPAAATSGSSAPPTPTSPPGGSSAVPGGDAANAVDKLALPQATSAPPVTANWKGRLRIERIVTETP